jgi:hypothetical protein
MLLLWWRSALISVSGSWRPVQGYEACVQVLLEGHANAHAKDNAGQDARTIIKRAAKPKYPP